MFFFLIYNGYLWHLKETNHTVQYNFYLKEKKYREVPSGPVVRTQNFHCQGPGSVPGWGTERSQIVRCGGGRRGSITIVDNNCKTHPGIYLLLIKFTGKQPCPFIYILSTAASELQRQSWAAAPTETEKSTKPKIAI